MVTNGEIESLKISAHDFQIANQVIDVNSTQVSYKNVLVLENEMEWKLFCICGTLPKLVTQADMSKWDFLAKILQ